MTKNNACRICVHFPLFLICFTPRVKPPPLAYYSKQPLPIQDPDRITFVKHEKPRKQAEMTINKGFAGFWKEGRKLENLVEMGWKWRICFTHGFLGCKTLDLNL